MTASSITIASAIVLTRRRKDTLGPIEAGAYWFISVLALQTAVLEIFVASKLSFLGKDSESSSANIISLILIALSVAVVAKRRGIRLSGIEIAVFWLGLSYPFIQAPVGIVSAFGVSPENASPYFVPACALAISAVGLGIAHQRADRRSDAETVIYWGGCIGAFAGALAAAIPLLNDLIFYCLMVLAFSALFAPFYWSDRRNYVPRST